MGIWRGAAIWVEHLEWSFGTAGPNKTRPRQHGLYFSVSTVDLDSPFEWDLVFAWHGAIDAGRRRLHEHCNGCMRIFRAAEGVLELPAPPSAQET